MRALHVTLGILLTLLPGISMTTDDNIVASNELCRIYKEIFANRFFREIANSLDWSYPPHLPGKEYGCGEIEYSEDGIYSPDQIPVCQKYRLDKMFYELRQGGHFGADVSYKIKRYILYLALKMTGDYVTVQAQCNIRIRRGYMDKGLGLYDKIGQMLGLIKKDGDYRVPVDQTCSKFISETNFGKLALQEMSDLYGDMFTACQHSISKWTHFCKYYTIDKFARMVARRLHQFKATATPCQVLKFAFVHSSFFFMHGIYAGKIIIEDEKIKEVLRSSLSTLASNVDDRGCRSNELQNYVQALQAYEAKDWYKQMANVIGLSSGNNGLFKMYCDVMDVIIRVAEYLGIIASSKRVVNAKLDYKTYLGLQEITGTLEQKFTQLGEYFLSIQSFNREKSDKDIEFIQSRLLKFEQDLTTVSKKVGATLGLILDFAVKNAKGNAISKGAKLGLAYAEACNPLKALFGGTSLSDIAAAKTEFIQANEQLKTSRQLKASMETLTNTVNGVKNGLRKNTDVINNAYKIITQKIALEGQDFERIKANFLQAYGDYDPAVDKNQIDLVGSQWETVVEDACSLIADTKDIHNFVFNGLGWGMLHEWLNTLPPDPCLSTKWEITQMVSLLGEIYDFQNDLMETCATHLRAKIAEDKALLFSLQPNNQISNEFTREDRLDLAKIYYNADRCILIQEFCAVLEYRDGGRRPIDCDNDKPNVPRLLASRARQKVEEFQLVNIPDLTEGVPKEQTIDIDRLMAGESVSFQIPNFDWLQNHADVHSSERNQDIFVKNVVIYAPFLTDGITSPVISKAKAVGVFKLQQGVPAYVFGEPFTSTFKYSEGTGFLACLYNLDPNQYTLCETDPLDRICPKMQFANQECNDEDVRVLFPSIYSKWNFQLLGYENTLQRQKLPVAKTKRNLKIVFIVCKFQSDYTKDKMKEEKINIIKKRSVTKEEKGNRRSSISKRSNYRCCSSSQFWNEDDNECQQCPTGSQQKLKGYYCGVNHPAEGIMKISARETMVTAGAQNTTSN